MNRRLHCVIGIMYLKSKDLADSVHVECSLTAFVGGCWISHTPTRVEIISSLILARPPQFVVKLDFNFNYNILES